MGKPIHASLIKINCQPNTSPNRRVKIMECGGKRSATPLLDCRSIAACIEDKHKPKRRRAPLAAALHNGNWRPIAHFCVSEFFVKKFFIAFARQCDINRM